MEGLYEAILDGSAIAVTVVLFLGSLFLMKKWRHRNRKYPLGLPSIPLVGSLPWLPSDTNHLTLTAFAKKYGNIYTVNFGKERAVFLNDFSSIKEAFVKQGALFADRPNYYTAQFINPQQKGVGRAHYDQTFLHNKQTSMSILRDLGSGKNVMEERILSEISDLILAFSEKCHEPFDPSELLYVSVANITNDILFNKKFAYDDQRFSTFLRIMREALKEFGSLQWVAYVPLFHYLPRVWRALQIYVVKQKKQFQFIEKELECIFKENTNDCQIDGFLSAYILRMEDKLDKDCLKNLVMDIYNGGTDTTSTTLRWTLVYMANYPDVQSRVQQEIDDVIGQGRPPSMSDRKSLRYVEAVLLEVQRLSTVTPLALPHRLTENTELQGLYLEKGSTVYSNLWAVHRNSDTWPDPARFDPKRFLDVDGEVIGRDCIIPFGLGRRSCMGEALARQELFLYFTSIMQRFVVSKPPGTDKLSEEGVFGLILSPAPQKLILSTR